MKRFCWQSKPCSSNSIIKHVGTAAIWGIPGVYALRTFFSCSEAAQVLRDPRTCMHLRSAHPGPLAASRLLAEIVASNMAGDASFRSTSDRIFKAPSGDGLEHAVHATALLHPLSGCSSHQLHVRYVYVHIHIDIFLYLHMYAHMYTNKYTGICTYTHGYSCIDVYMHVEI